MFQLILHHPYRRVPQAIDISGMNIHGTVHQPGTGFAEDGREPRSGALAFNDPRCRVRVRPAAVFQKLTALKIEMVVRLKAFGQRRNLIEGDSSFAFFIHPDGSLWGTSKGRESPTGPLDFFGTNTEFPGGAKVPLNQWVTLTFIHDGFSTIQLAIDGQVVASRNDLYSPILPVGGYGVHIGNWPAGDSYPFAGEIDDVKLWRWDPDAAQAQFFSREPGRCWKGVFDALTKMGRDEVGRRNLIALLKCLAARQHDLIRAVRSKGAAAVERNEHFSRRYRELWADGALGAEEMLSLVDEWLRWLAQLLGDEELTDHLRGMANCYHEYGRQIDTAPGERLAECDPEFHAYIKALMNHPIVRSAQQ